MTSFIVNLLKKKIPVGRRRTITRITRKLLRKWMLSTATGKLGLHMVAREELYNDSEKYHVLPFGSSESIVVSEPYNSSDQLPRFITNRIGTINLKQPFVAEVRNAELIGSTAVGFDRDRNLLLETVDPIQEILKTTLIPTRTLILNNLPSLGVTQLDTVCSLINWEGKNYFHWIIDCLLRLEGIEYYQEKTGIKPVLLIDSNPPEWQLESLSILGYAPDDCIRWNGSRIQVKRLVVPSFRREQSIEESIISATACQWFRQRILSNLPDVGSKNLSFSSRVYISRTKIVGRNVINEDEVLEALSPLGFVAYTLETMSFSDQVRLFSQAEIVVAPHGAGLTNTIFAKKLIVIELFGSFGTPSYLVLAKGLGFQYACLTSDHSNQHSGISRHKDMMVDIPKLRALVAQMLNISDTPNPGGNRHPVNTAY